MPQLKFHYAGDVPVYSTSESYEPDPRANADIDGLLFADMPWMVSSDPATSEIRDAVHSAWPARTARRDRLYAFGFDAYRLVPALEAARSDDNAGILRHDAAACASTATTGSGANSTGRRSRAASRSCRPGSTAGAPGGM